MNFKKFFYENINKSISKSAWNDALQTNEELNKGHDVTDEELYAKGTEIIKDKNLR